MSLIKTPDGLPPLRDVIERHELRAKKALGQNFLLDLNVTRKIARACGDLSGRTVVEVGPGPGGLTRALLLEGAKRVIAIERDARCMPALAEIAARYPGQLDVHEGDALDADWLALIGGDRPVTIAANLPYGIASILLVGWLETQPWPPWFDRMVLMFQREVAERIVAEPGSKAYGRLSVLAQWRTTPRIVLHLPPEAFTPPPKVASAVVEFVPRRVPSPPCSVATLARVTQAAFGQRRKMLRASLKQLTPFPELLLREAGIDPELRAERLSIDDFGRLACIIERGDIALKTPL
ncbi:MAG: 16S rRNA (adenine(1518)-N(6)/adenine(1519)-N(6))-dimethyltransferase RsmA [Hyphomicrobium sp.]|nr:16S rRNA (adenine(1518)-N(6)/adenine(1519)-N(6))-dimethyltransferase RsmA [Hyphomicrobium sp.]